ISFTVGARMLLEAFEQRPHRAEPLRALANSANAVADKIPYPKDDQLFVWRPHYKSEMPALATPEPVIVPPLPPIKPTVPGRPDRRRSKSLPLEQVTAVMVTRGNVDVRPTLEPVLAAGITDVVVWDNSLSPIGTLGEAIVPGKYPEGVRVVGGHDYKCFGRYAAIPYARNPVILWVDDDVVFTAFDELLALYEPGRLVTNMDASWIDAAGYRDVCALQGAGSLCDSWLPERVWARYFNHYPWDEEAMVEADFA